MLRNYGNAPDSDQLSTIGTIDDRELRRAAFSDHSDYPNKPGRSRPLEQPFRLAKPRAQGRREVPARSIFATRRPVRSRRGNPGAPCLLPIYAVTGADPGFLAYARAWLSHGSWPAGPAWFIWLLLVFDAVAAEFYVLRHRWARMRGPRGTSAWMAPRRASSSYSLSFRHWSMSQWNRSSALTVGSYSVPFHFRRAVRCSMRPIFWPGYGWAPLAHSAAFLRATSRWHSDGQFGFQPGLPPMRYGSPSS